MTFPLSRPSLRSRLESGRTAVTAEVGPPRGADPEAVRRKVEPLRGWVDAVNITDSQSAHVRLSNWAGSLIALAAGVEPVMQVTCSDRNRIALQSDLLSAAALGIGNLLLMTGDHPRFGDHPDAKLVFDLDSVQLVWTARTMRDEGRLLSGRELDPPPHGVPPGRVADEGMTVCAEIIQQVLQIPGVSGVHVMAPGFERAIPEILDRAGLARPGQAQLAAAAAAGGSGVPGVSDGSGHAH
jgi:5,10-methylenetetrahydrofolate reductase